MAVGLGVDAALDLAISLGGNMGPDAVTCGQINERFRVVASVCDQIAGSAEAFDERNSGLLVGSLSRCEGNANGQALAIDDDVDLGAQSSTRTADGVIRAPLFPPAACWWALMIELSISAMDCGDRSASVSNIRSQTPALAHRL